MYTGKLIHWFLVAACLLLAGCQSSGNDAAITGQRLTDGSGQRDPVVAQRPLRGPSTRDPIIQIETGSHSAEVSAVAMSRDGRYVVTTSYDKTARIWDARDGHLLHILRPAIGDAQFGKLYALAIHPTKDLIAVGGTTGRKTDEHRVLFFRLSDGRYVRSLPVPGDVSALGWAGRGDVLLVTLSSAQGGILAFGNNGQRHFAQTFNAPTLGLAVSKDGKQVATTAIDGLVRTYRVRGLGLELVRQFAGNGGRPHGIAFSPNAEKLLIGYRSQRGETLAPSVHDSGSGALIRQLERPKVKIGAVGVVAWSTDGNTLYAGGRGYERPGEFSLYQFDASSGKLRTSSVVASDSVLQLTALNKNRMLIASADGAWTMFNSGQSALRVGGDSPDLRGPARLVINADATRVGFTRRYGKQPLWFDFSTRVLNHGSAPTGLAPPRQRGGVFAKTVWRNVRQPVVRGSSVPMRKNEVARSIAFLSDAKSAVLGSSDHLRLIDQNGAIRWQVPTGGEVWAVNVSADDKTIVSAMGDGTIRWWRSRTGELLMTLFTGPGNTWVLWSPSGYFDASSGADKLVGWSVNNVRQPVADFYSLSRFRGQLLRPDLIDQLLIKPAKSTSENSTQRQLTQQKSAIAVTALPPVIRGGGEVSMSASANQVRIPFTVRAKSPLRVELRVNGRPVRGARIRTPEVLDGQSRALATIPVDQSLVRASLQLIAIDANGVSEPLVFDINRALLASAERYRAIRTRPATILPRRTSGYASNVLLESGVKSTPLKARNSRLVVLAIGVSQYELSPYNLDLAAKDAKDFLTTIAAQRGRFYSSVESRLLVDKQASSASIRDSLQWLQSRVRPQDTAMVFIAGHGLNGPAGRYYFLPWDGRHRNLAGTSIPESTLRESLGNVLGQTILFLDTCNAGSVGALSASRQDQRHLANGLADSDTGVIVFASSAGRQFAEENEAWGNGAFTGALIDGLKGQASASGDGNITHRALDLYVASRVARLTEGRQTPVTNVPIALPDFTIAAWR